MVSAQTASKGLSEAIKPLQADLFVLRGKTKPKRKREALDWEIHVNPFGLAVAAVGGALTLAILQLRAARTPVHLVDSMFVDTVVPWNKDWVDPIATAMFYALPKGFSWYTPSVDATADYAFKNDATANLFRSGVLGPGAQVIAKVGDFLFGQTLKGMELVVPPYDVTNQVLYDANSLPTGIRIKGHCYKVLDKFKYTLDERKSLVSVV